jgi:hypothetical protein
MLWNKYCIIVRISPNWPPETFLERIRGSGIRLIRQNFVDQQLSMQVHHGLVDWLELTGALHPVPSDPRSQLLISGRPGTRLLVCRSRSSSLSTF